jgi:hypothetical protein
MIVKKFPQAAYLFRFNREFRRKPLLEIPHRGANLGVIGEDPHDFGVPVEPNVPGIGRQQKFLLFAKMHVPRLVPEADKLLRLTCNRSRTSFCRRFGRAPHLQRLNQREVVMLAKWVQTRMAFHCLAVFFVKPMACDMPVGFSLTRWHNLNLNGRNIRGGDYPWVRPMG